MVSRWETDRFRLRPVGLPSGLRHGADGSNIRRLTYEGGYNSKPSWSPKGDRIAFCGRSKIVMIFSPLLWMGLDFKG